LNRNQLILLVHSAAEMADSRTPRRSIMGTVMDTVMSSLHFFFSAREIMKLKLLFSIFLGRWARPFA
jgi:hypothetical protein